MLLKKSWFSYVLWFLYTVLMVYLSTVFVYATVVGVFYQSSVVAIVAVVLFFLLTAGFYFAGRQLLIIRKKRHKPKPSKADAWEHFFWVIICLSAIIYRIYLTSIYTVEMTQEDVFYRVAMTRGGFSTPFLMHGATESYTYLLSMLFSLTGVKLFYGIVFQCIFTIAGMLLFFFAIKILAGRIPAFTALLFLSFSPYSVRTLYSLSPTALYMMLYALALLLITRYLNKERKKGSKGKGLLSPILLGLFVGFMFYLDLSGITLLIFGAMIFGVKWRRLESIVPQERDIKCKEEKKKSLVQFLCMTGATLGMFLVLAFLDSFRHGMNVFSLIGKLVAEYGNRLSLQFNFMGVTGLFGSAFCFVCMLLVYGFWMHKRQKGAPWIAVLLIICFIKFTSISLIDYNYILAVTLAVLAGIGIKSMSPEKTYGLSDTDIEFVSMDEAEDEQAEMLQDTMVPTQEQTEIPKEPVVILQEQAEASKETQVIPLETTAEAPKETPAIPPETAAEDTEKKVTLIDNPLPLPKKREFKAMDYDLAKAEDDFDFDSFEDDDFDY